MHPNDNLNPFDYTGQPWWVIVFVWGMFTIGVGIFSVGARGYYRDVIKPLVAYLRAQAQEKIERKEIS